MSVLQTLTERGFIKERATIAYIPSNKKTRNFDRVWDDKKVSLTIDLLAHLSI